MPRQHALVAAICLACWACRPQPDVTDVIVDHDGGVDDFVAIALLMKAPAVRVRAVTVCPGDSYLEPAARATGLFLDRLGASGVTIALGHSEGTHPFPDEWRKDAARVLTIPSFAGAQPSGANPVVNQDAAHHLAALLSGPRRFTILETGPLTNIADALQLNPDIKKAITRIFVMGGAVRVKGNVDRAGHDGSAEWNIFNQPQAAADVIRSGIPVTLVPLDATNKAPLTLPFLAQLRGRDATAARLASESWQLVAGREGLEQYYFWDTLTAAALVAPAVVATQTLRVAVVTTGASQGRTVEDANGSAVDVALDARQSTVEKTFLDLLGR